MAFEGTSAELDTSHAAGAATALRTTVAVRTRARQLLERARVGASRWFVVHDDALHNAATDVAALTLRRYPDLHIPLYSRWRQFDAGGVHRKAELDARLAPMDPPARARAMIDLVVVSVLLELGTSPDWRYHEAATGQRLERSEGLAVASWHAFLGGMFSSDALHPLQVDAVGLRALLPEHLAQAFQASEAHPLVGLEERVRLLRRLGESMAAQPEVFGPTGRPGGLFDMLVAPHGLSRVAPTASITAHDILSQLLMSLSGLWPAPNHIGNEALGDCWPHSAVDGPGLTAGWMPLHALSQWLTCSLIEPFQWAGVQVRQLDALTGLPDNRNGGLLLDAGVLALRDPAWAQHTWQPGDELVVEWRALTVALLDELADSVRAQLGRSAAQLPLAGVLEGGTSAAGHALAQQLRGGLPPLHITSDSTVF
jgi:hypothetical protein